MNNSFYDSKKATTIALTAHEGAVYTVRFSPDGDYLLSSGVDSNITLYNVHKGSLVTTFDSIHSQDVLDVICLQDNARLASCGMEKIVCLTDTIKKEVIRQFFGHYERVNSLAINEDLSVLVTGSFDKRVHLWDVKGANKGPIQTLKEAKDSITRVLCFNQTIVSSSVDGFIRIYDIRKGSLVQDNIKLPVTGLDVSFNRRYVLASTTESQIALYDILAIDSFLCLLPVIPFGL